MVKNQPVMRETHVPSLGWEDPLEKGMATHSSILGLPGDSDSKVVSNVGDSGSIPGSGRVPGKGNGYPLQYSYLKNSMDRGTWQATVHGVAKELHMPERLSLLFFEEVLICTTLTTTL